MLVEKHTATAALAATAVLASLTLCGPARAEAPDIRPLVDEIVSGSAARPGDGAPGSGDSAQGPEDTSDLEGDIALSVPNAVAAQSMRGNAAPGPTGSAAWGAGASGSASAGDESGFLESPLGLGGGPPARAVARGARPEAEERGEIEIGNPVAAFGLDTGSVATACAGSAVAGSSAVLLGSATGSGLVPGLIGPGSAGSGAGSAAVGLGSASGSSLVPGLVGTGSGVGSAGVALGSSLVPGLIGTGSSGSALGSAAVGSALSGSALLTCLLLLPPIPPLPELPLQFPPLPAPPLPVAPPSPKSVNAPSPPPAPEQQQAMPAPRRERPSTPALPDHHTAINTVILMTLLVVAAAASRGRATIRRTRL